jgi:glycosyltransferase involved in cell wall biosynthesis
MEITCYSHYFVPEIGAPSSRISDLSREWLRMGHRPRVVTCFPNHPAGEIYPGYRLGLHLQETIDGIDVHRLWSYVTPNRGIIKKTLGHISFMAAAMIAPQRVTGSAEVVIGTSPTLFAAIAAAWVAARQHVPFVMEVRDLWPALFSELRVLNNRAILRVLEWLELSLYRKASGIVTVTESFRQNLIARGVPDWKVLTIPNGADLDFWQPALANPAGLRERLGLKGKFTVLYIGAHGISQGLGAIVRAAELLRDDSSIEFLFVGDGADKPSLIERVRTSGPANVRFLDAVSKAEVRDFYAMADVCLVPLRDIPLFRTFIPSKMFEMLAMGSPIVASVAGEAAGILERSGGAVVVPPEESAAIAAAIRLMRESDNVPMRQRGRAFVEEHYSRRSLAARYVEFLEQTRDNFRRGAVREHW